jgi:hypothetical protein
MLITVNLVTKDAETAKIITLPVLLVTLPPHSLGSLLTIVHVVPSANNFIFLILLISHVPFAQSLLEIAMNVVLFLNLLQIMSHVLNVLIYIT